jgi:hypothetical protein
MIAGRRTDDAARTDLFGQLCDLVVGTAQLEREHRLHVFALEQHGVADAPRQVGRKFERRFDRHVVHLRVEDLFEVVDVHDVEAASARAVAGMAGTQVR